jgi:hypothetical protein
MHRPRLRVASRSARHREPDEDQPNWEPELFTTSDQVLLCCFGLDQAAERSGEQLRTALVEAGFTSTGARRVIRASGLIHRTSNGSYRLRAFKLKDQRNSLDRRGTA